MQTLWYGSYLRNHDGQSMSEHDVEKLTPDEKFYLIMVNVERLKQNYADQRQYILTRSHHFGSEKDWRAEQRTKLVKLEEEALESMANLLNRAARIYGYNPTFRVRTQDDRLWYEARNKSAQRMLERVELCYLDHELKRG